MKETLYNVDSGANNYVIKDFYENLKVNVLVLVEFQG